jgi:hypothetical protein
VATVFGDACAHDAPHAPQLSGSMLVSVHTPSQARRPAWQESSQAPAPLQI